MTKRSYTGEHMRAGGSFLRRFCGDETGAVLVETAIILPLMITLSAGVYEFSNAIYTRLLLESGVADAARYISRCVHDDGDATEVTNCETNAKNLAVCGTVGSGADLADCSSAGTVRVTGWTTADVTPEFSTVPITVVDTTTGEQNYRSSTDHVTIVKVITDYNYSASGRAGLGLLGVLGLGPLTLSVAHEERVVGW